MTNVGMSEVQRLLGPVHLAKAAFEKVSKNEMSEFEYGLFQQNEATRLYPEARTLSEALTKYFNSEAGRVGLAPRRAQTAAENAELMKREGKVPHVHAEEASGHATDDGGDSGSDVDKVISLLMDRGMSRDEAATAVLRAARAKRSE